VTKTYATFAALLNDFDLLPVCDEGKVSLDVHTDLPPGRSPGWEDLHLLLEHGVGFEKGYLGEHPEGSDRGGYVPYVVAKDGQTAYYCENEGEWYPVFSVRTA